MKFKSHVLRIVMSSFVAVLFTTPTWSHAASLPSSLMNEELGLLRDMDAESDSLTLLTSKDIERSKNRGAYVSPFTSSDATAGGNYYVQFGLDMSLQNPYGYKFSEVFPKGKTFGMDLAIGKWFTPEVGLRAKLNWENGLPLLKNDHAEWLAPFGRNGISHEKGGYMGFYAEMHFDLHHIFAGYQPMRKWNAIVYPRTGFTYDFSVSKGALLVGFGTLQRFRLNNRLSLFCDAAYQKVASGHTGGSAKSTGTGTGSNSYFDVNVGVQWNLNRESFPKVSERAQADPVGKAHAWDWSSNWFVQMGLDMALQNPYGYSFSKVFPEGKTWGIQAAVGKWVSPTLGFRLGVNWQNGLITNDHLSRVAPFGRNGINHEKGGFIVFYGEALLNLRNFFLPYDANRRWNLILHPRAGLDRNFAIGSFSPMLGLGLENTYRLSRRFSLAFDFAYQVTTSEFTGDASTTGMQVGSGSNGFFDTSLGVIFDL